jgi:hypothetical protein
MPCSLAEVHWHFRGWQQAELCFYLLHASCWILVFPTLSSQRLRQYVPLKHQWTCTSLHGVTSQKLVTIMRISDLTGTFLVATMSRMVTRSTQCSILWVQGTGHSPQRTVKSWEFVKLGIHATSTSSWYGPVLSLLNKKNKFQVSFLLLWALSHSV